MTLEIQSQMSRSIVASPRRRLVGVAMDSIVVAGWAGFAALIGAALAARDAVPQTAAGRDLLAFFTLVLPVTLTFAVQEAGPRGATLGKRWMRSSVRTVDGGDLGFWRSMARTGLKFLPWQLAHTAVFHLVAGSRGPLPLTLAIVAQVLVVLNVIVMASRKDHRAVHDLLAGTVVIANSR